MLDNLAASCVYGAWRYHNARCPGDRGFGLQHNVIPPERKGRIRLVVSGKGAGCILETDRIPEMKDLDVDIALLPVSGTYVMDGRSRSLVETSNPVM